jgi:hypothetical protein
VIFGCRTKDGDRNALLKHLKDYGYDHVQLKRAMPSDSSYTLKIENV